MEKEPKIQRPKTWVIEVSEMGEIRPVGELVEGELLKRFSGSLPEKPGVYQWRPVRCGDYECDPATGGMVPVKYGWGEGVIPEEEWIKSKLYPVGI